MQNLTFDQLPIAVNQLNLQLERIENLLLKQAEYNAPEPKDQLFSIQEAAKFLNLAVPTIYAMVRRRELPFMKRSKRLYFSQIELLTYLREGRKKTNIEIESGIGDFLGNKKGVNHAR